MPYTFIMMRPDRTDKGARSFTVPKSLFWGLLILAVTAPFVVYYLTYHIIAPTRLIPEVGELREKMVSVKDEIYSLQMENKKLNEQNDQLTTDVNENKQMRAEAETRITIAETARATATTKMQSLEDKIYELEQAVSFYEAFFKPDTEKEVMQCFNISIDKNEDKLKYGVNFLTLDQASRERIKAKVHYKVISGKNVKDMTAGRHEKSQSDKVEDLSMVKTVRLSGELTVKNLMSDGLNVLDIKAYDVDNKVIAHCWKAF